MIIDTIKSKYNLNNKSTREIALMPEGVLIGYSNEIEGELLIVKLRSNIEIKVSENELSDCTKKFYFNKTFTSNFNKILKDFIEIEYIFAGNRKIKEILNPLNFLQWIKYTFKDIF